MSGNLNLPKDKDLAVHMINGAQAKEQLVMKMGWVGRVFGSGDEKAGNIAGIVLVVCIAAVLFLLSLAAVYPEAKLSEAIAGFFTVITTTVGYIFGRKSSE
ncbi:hypothetical protein [Agrobacterium tumefaciens]|uniref:hypothetical protein n=1 Tax=Agrobacterium tumefaciens TaxID=358 RepID=UPI0021CE0453|nr:hypothetical protein [Agrobacterium tumefaciens]UXS09215.1 hypothetical protein FY155_06175 [Agrobacterium tumefaciens]UXS16574.1 hypothetical protein FY154_06170 [Agrobacterium tumefaciens]